MATTRWTGATDGGFTDNANWSGNTAADNDIAIIPAGATQTINDDLSAAGVDVDLLLIEKGCGIDVGTSGTYLSIAADKVVHRGTGTLYYNSAQSAGEVTDVIIIDSDNETDAAYLSDDGTSSITQLIAMGGAVTCTSAATNGLTKCNVCASDANLTVENGFGTVVDMWVSSGEAHIYETVTRLHVTGGVAYVYTGGTATSLYVSGSGTCVYNSVGGTITYANVTGSGFLDFSQSNGQTVTNMDVLGPNAKVNQGDGQVTFTNTPNVIGGGSIYSTSGGSVGI